MIDDSLCIRSPAQSHRRFRILHNVFTILPCMLLQSHPPSDRMSHYKSTEFIRKNWISWLFNVGFTCMVLFARVTLEDTIQGPSSSLPCISECATCPTICSPPPPPLLTSFPSPLSPAVSRPPPSLPAVPSAPHSPSPTYTFPQTPPKSPAVPLMPPPPPPSPPPPSLPLLPAPTLTSPSSHPSGAAPPPPPKSYNNNPPSGVAQPTVVSGPHEYSYPYYYYYSSDSTSLAVHAPLLLLTSFLHRAFSC